MDRSALHGAARAGLAELVSFRAGWYDSLGSWADALFELADALVCNPTKVTSVPSLSLEPEFSRSHGSLYKALQRGRIDEVALRELFVSARHADWPLVFAVDASTWARCDAECSPGRGYYYSASHHSAGQPIVAGWSYQWINQLSFSPDSWTAPMDVMRLPLELDATSATIGQVKRLVGLLPDEAAVPLFVFDAGYDAAGLPTGCPPPAPRSSCASPRPGSSTPIRPSATTTRGAGLDATARASHSPIGAPGHLPTPRHSSPTDATARSPSPPGTTSTRNCTDGAGGREPIGFRSCVPASCE